MLKAWSYKQNKIEAEWKWETEVLITNKIEYIQQASSVMRSILKIRDTLIRTNRIQEKKIQIITLPERLKELGT
jgi:hypothetical protein